MLSISKSQQLLIAVVLMLLMIITRGNHFASVNALPSASWAIFFLAGVYLSRKFWLPVLMALAISLDLSAVYWNGAGIDCLSAAYGFMLAGYASLWWGGRWYASKHQFQISTLFPLVAIVLLTAVSASLLSGGSYYWLSGNYDPSWAEYWPRFLKYFPNNLTNLAFYVAMAAIVHIAFHFSRLGQKADQQH